MTDSLKIVNAMKRIEDAGFIVNPQDDTVVVMADIAEAVSRLQNKFDSYLTSMTKPLPDPFGDSTLEGMMERVATNNKRHGWFDEDRPFSADIALLHSEVSEVYEAYRAGKANNTPLDIINVSDYDKDSIGAELADVFIRLLDTCYRMEIDLEHEFKCKMEYNEGRSYRHGGKVE